MLFLGRGFLLPVALEGALKMKEISYRAGPGADVGRVPAWMWRGSRRRCGAGPGADVARVPARMWQCRG